MKGGQNRRVRMMTIGKIQHRHNLEAGSRCMAACSAATSLWSLFNHDVTLQGPRRHPCKTRRRAAEKEIVQKNRPQHPFLTRNPEPYKWPPSTAPLHRCTRPATTGRDTVSDLPRAAAVTLCRASRSLSVQKTRTTPPSSPPLRSTLGSTLHHLLPCTYPPQNQPSLASASRPALVDQIPVTAFGWRGIPTPSISV